MPTFAVLSSNTVSNVIVADDQTIAETVTGAVCVEYTDENPAGIGWIYDETNGTFTALAAAVVVVVVAAAPAQ